MELFASVPVEEVTVQDIAAAVEMTPAAVYYHFASKEQILIEGMQAFRDELLVEAEADRTFEGLSDDGAGDDGVGGDDADDSTTGDDVADDELGDLLVRLLQWASDHRTHATVYFVHSLGLNMMVEALRRETRVILVEVFREVVASLRADLNRAETGVIAVALVSLLESSLALMLNQDPAFRGLGMKPFAGEVVAVAHRIACPPAP